MLSRPLARARPAAISSRFSRFRCIHDDLTAATIVNRYKDCLNLPKPSLDRLSPNLREHVGEVVQLNGYLGERVDVSKKLAFVPFVGSDLETSVQIVSTAGPAHTKLRGLDAHIPVSIRGLVKARDAEAASSSKTNIKDVEIQLIEVAPYNTWPKDVIVAEGVRFSPSRRPLQTRTDAKLRETLRTRSQIASICRRHLENKGFLEVETPILFKSTSEGAREFLVPTRQQGKVYALPQSPQQYKQMLIASGIPRYYQIARCFRDEDLRADRQPEFTQLDLEMSFAGAEQVMSLIESLVRELWQEVRGVELAPKFEQRTFASVMAQYGVDKPDLRINTHIHDITAITPPDLISKLTDIDAKIEACSLRFSSNAATTRTIVKEFLDLSDSARFHKNPAGAPGVFVVDHRMPLSGLHAFNFEAADQIIEKFQLEQGDLLLVQARKEEVLTSGTTMLGRLIREIHAHAVQKGVITLSENDFRFLWVTDFPLFSALESTDAVISNAGFKSTHHPFTSPKGPADVETLLTDPLLATGDHYDLVVNGIELGGGSKRIHDAEMQELVFRDILQLSPEKIQSFSHLLDALRIGCPPHAGIALGFDRLIAVMLGLPSVRDVIAFPKWGAGEDPTVRSPAQVSDQDLATYGLKRM